MNRGSVLLMYHRVTDRAASNYDVSRSEFERQCQLLAGQRVISLDALLAGDGGVGLSFDDGFESCLAVAPRLAERGWPATAYVTTGYLGRPGYLRRSDLRELRASGFTIGAHGHTHRPLTSLDERELAFELSLSRSLIEDAIGARVVHMALPNGKGHSRVTRAARAAGFVSIATSWPSVIHGLPKPYAVPRFALRRFTQEAEFSKILARSPTLLVETQARQLGATLLSRVLGTRVYAFLRSARQTFFDREP